MPILYFNHETQTHEKIEFDEYKDWTLVIRSQNNFPTAVGLASSASGFCCFTLVLSVIFQYFGNYQDMKLERRDIDLFIEDKVINTLSNSKEIDEMDFELIKKVFEIIA